MLNIEKFAKKQAKIFGDNLRNKMAIRYILAVLILGLLTITANIIMSRYIENQEKYYSIINISCLQRAYSQRLVALTYTLEDRIIKDNFDEFKKVLSVFENNHRFLTQRDNPTFESPELYSFYYGLGQLDLKSKLFIESGKKIIEAIIAGEYHNFDNFRFVGYNELFKDLNWSVGLFEKEAFYRLNQTYQRQQELVIIIFMFLVIEIIFIFRPMANIVSKQSEDIYLKSMSDDLTELPNRSTLDAQINLIDKSKPFVLALINIDWFKEINQTEGHLVADFIIKTVGKRLSLAIGEGFCARLDGDEFFVVFQVDNSESLNTLNKLKASIQSGHIEIDGRILEIKISIGAVHSDDLILNNINLEMDEMIECADRALKKAKKTGKNKISFFDPTVKKEIEIEKKIRKMLDENNFEGLTVAFQPQICLKKRCIFGFESLARWTLPTGEKVSPFQFIEIAGRYGYLSYLGRQLRKLSFEKIIKLRKNGYNVPQIALNVSLLEFVQNDVLSEILEDLEIYNLKPSDVEIEITEDIMLDSKDMRVVSTIKKFTDYGFFLSIDDFGAGYSGFTNLLNIPAHVIKMDKSFIQNANENARACEILKSTVQLAHNLDIKVMAEGVETLEQLKLINSLGFDIVQGYFFAKPMIYEDLVLWLDDLNKHLEKIDSI